MPDLKPLTDEHRGRIDALDDAGRILALKTHRAAGFDITPYKPWLAPREQPARLAAKLARRDQGPGVGEAVKRKLAWVPGAHCERCAGTARKMDKLGPAECREQVKQLAEEMVANFRARGILAKAVDFAAQSFGKSLATYCRDLILEACDEVEAEASLGLPVVGGDQVRMRTVEVVRPRLLTAVGVVDRSQGERLLGREEADPKGAMVREAKRPVHEVVDPLHSSAALTLSPSTSPTLPIPAAAVNRPVIARGIEVTP